MPLADTSIIRFIAGTLILIAMVGPLVVGAISLRRAYLPALPQASRALADAVLTLAGLIICAELAGAVKLLAALPVTLLCVVLGTGVTLACRRRTPAADPGATPAGSLD